jgi:hypothetical protein
MQQQEKTIPVASSTAPAKPGRQGCGQCKCSAPAPAPQPVTWERKNPDDTEGGEL